MDWANLEKIAHHEARLSSARKMSTMPMSLSTPAFDRVGGRSQSVHATLNFDQTIRTVSQETNATLMEELSNMRKSFYALSINVQEIQENLSRNVDLAYDLKKGRDIVDVRCEEFDKLVKSLNANQQKLMKETESIQFSMQKIVSAQGHIQENLSTSREGQLSRETFSKVMDSTSAELRTVKEAVGELFKTSDRSSIQIENLLLSIIDLGSVESVTQENSVSLLRSLATDGFAHQIRRILTESLQAGVDLSLQKHLKVLQSSMNQSIVIMLKEYRERQNATLLPDMEKLKALFDEFSRMREDCVNMHSSFNSLKAQIEVERLRAVPALPPAPEIITVDETVRADLDSARQDIIALQDQIAKLSSRVNTQSENLNASTAAQETLRVAIQENRNYLISEYDKSQSKTGLLIREVEDKLGDLIGRSTTPLDRKIKDMSDRNLSLSLDVHKLKDEVDGQNRDFSQQLIAQDAAVREEMKNLLHINQLDHEEIRRELIRSIRSSEITSIQEDITTKTEQRLQALHQEQLIFVNKLKGLASEIDGCHSKMINEKEEVRQLLNHRDLDISRRLQERIAHWESCQKDWQSLQEAKIEEANRQVVTLSIDLKEMKPQENIDRLKDEVSNLQVRLQGLRSKQDVMDIGLRKENDGLRNELLKQLQGVQDKMQGISRLIDTKQAADDQALKNLQDKLYGEQDRLLEQLENLSTKQRALELGAKEAKDQSARLEGKIGSLEIELHESSESKHALLEEKISSGLQILQSNLGKSIKECDIELQLLRKDVSILTNRVEENHADSLQKLLGFTENNQKQAHDMDALFTDKLHKVDRDLQKTKLENDQNLQAIATQEEQLSRLLEQHEADIKSLHEQFQRQKELHDSDMTATRSILRADQQKQGKSHQEAIDEIRFDLTQTANRVLILEQTSLQLQSISSGPTKSSAGNVRSVRNLSPEKKLGKESSAKRNIASDANRDATIDVDMTAFKRECLEAMLPIVQQKAENSEIISMKSKLDVHQQAMEQLQEWCQSYDQRIRQFEQHYKDRDSEWDKTFEDSLREVSKQNHRDIASVQQELSVLKAELQQQGEKFKEAARQVSDGVFPLLSRQRDELAGLQQSLLQLKGAVANLTTYGPSAPSNSQTPQSTVTVAVESTSNNDSKNEVKLAAEPRLPLPSVHSVTVKQLTEVDQRLTMAVGELRELLESQRKEVEDMTSAMNEKQTEIIGQLMNDRSISRTSIESIHRLLDVLQDEVGKHDDVQEQHQHAIDKLDGLQRSLQASLTTVYATLTSHIEEHARWSSAQQNQAHNHHHHHHHQSDSHPHLHSSTSQPSSPQSHLLDLSQLNTSQNQHAISSISPHASPHGLRSVSHLRSLCAGSRSIDGSNDNPHGGDDDNQSVASLASSNFSSPTKAQQQQQVSRRSSHAAEGLLQDTSPDQAMTPPAHNQVQSPSHSSNISSSELHHHRQNPKVPSQPTSAIRKLSVTKELAPIVTPISQHHHHNHSHLRIHQVSASPALSPDSGTSGGEGTLLHQPARLVKSPALSTPGATLSANASVSFGAGGSSLTIHKQAALGPLSPAGMTNSQINMAMQPSPPSADKAPQGSGVSPRIRVTTPLKSRSFGSPSEYLQDSSGSTSPKEQSAGNVLKLRSNSLEQSGDLSSNSWDADQSSPVDAIEQSQASQSSFYDNSPSKHSQSIMSADGSFLSSMNSSPEKTATSAGLVQQQVSQSRKLQQQALFSPENVRDRLEESQNSFASSSSFATEPSLSYQPTLVREDNRVKMPPSLRRETYPEPVEESSHELSTMSIGEEVAVAAGNRSPQVESVRNADEKGASISHRAHEPELEDKFVSDSSSDDEKHYSRRAPNRNTGAYKSGHTNLKTLDASDLQVEEEEEVDEEGNDRRDDDALPPHLHSPHSSEVDDDRLLAPSRTQPVSSAAVPTMVVSGSLLGRANVYPAKKR